MANNATIACLPNYAWSPFHHGYMLLTSTYRLLPSTSVLQELKRQQQSLQWLDTVSSSTYVLDHNMSSLCKQLHCHG